MTISTDIAKLLSGVAPITGAIDGKTVGVYAMATPSKDLKTRTAVKPPYIIVTKMSTDFFNGIDGTQTVATGVRRAEVDIDIRGKTAKEAGDIFNQVAIFLDDYSGAAGESVIMAVELDDGGEGTEPPLNGENLPVFVQTLSANIILQ